MINSTIGTDAAVDLILEGIAMQNKPQTASAPPPLKVEKA